MEHGIAVKARVRVVIADLTEYAGGCAESLNDRLGVVEEHQPHWTISHPSREAFLVRFDEPAEPWHAFQEPVRAFWFEPKDLRLELEAEEPEEPVRESGCECPHACTYHGTGAWPPRVP